MLFEYSLYTLLALAIGTPISTEVDQEASPQLSIHYMEDLRRYAKFSAISYCSREADGLKKGELKTACGGSYSLCTESQESVEVVYIYRGDINGVIFKDNAKRELILSFKGTTNSMEWQLNLDTKTKKYYSLESNEFICDGCRVHSGFYQGAKEVWGSVGKKLVELVTANPEYKISITGHSLGGAIAVLIGNEFKLLGHELKLVTYGQPKVGDFKTTSWMDEIWGVPKFNDANGVLPNAMTRVTNKGDVVPFVPLTTMGFGHSGSEIYFKDGTLPTNEESAVVRGKWSRERTTKEELGVTNIILRTGQTRLIHNTYFVKMNKCLK